MGNAAKMTQCGLGMTIRKWFTKKRLIVVALLLANEARAVIMIWLIGGDYIKSLLQMIPWS